MKGMIFGRACVWSASIALLSAPLLAQPTIVLIGGKTQNTPDGEDDFPDGVIKLDRLIKASPDFAKIKPVVKLYPAGFPKDLSQIDDASVIVFYFGPGGRGPNPVTDPTVSMHLDRLMARGVGLVALHQSFTADGSNSAKRFAAWLGASRAAVSGQSTEVAPAVINTKSHPIASGLSNFQYLDELYSGVTFEAGVTPILSARIHPQVKGAVTLDPAKTQLIAWSLVRADAGRSFGFSGGHYLAALDQPQVRKMILNAILWTAKETVPTQGVTTTLPVVSHAGEARPREATKVFMPFAEVKPEPQPWGKLEWFAGRPQQNSDTMTVGQATILPGKENPLHWHPNCDEVLHVVKGHIIHRVGDKEYEMNAGDTVVIPEGTYHNARNIGSEDAVLMVSFNSADRYAIGE